MRRSGRSSILFHVKTRDIRRRTLREFIHTLTAEVTDGHAFCCLITNDDELRRLNREFRGKDYATDVLSFPAVDCSQVPKGQPLPPGNRALGEIAISLEHAQQQAAALAHGTEQELQILMLHGILHLTGLDHEKDRGAMARAERRWRKHFGLPAGLIERVSL